MGSDPAREIHNYLLKSMSPDDLAVIDALLEPVSLPCRFVLERLSKPIEHVYFVNSGIASTVAHAGRERHAEVGIFGRDGMSGTAVLLGNHRSSHECFMQVGGDGLRLASDEFRHAMQASRTLQASLLRYVQTLLSQTAQTALSNAQAKLEERLGRWLLMCHDRIDGAEIDLTHEFLATMLGVRRAGVTTAVHVLEGRGLIRTARGCITVLDREGLEVLANSTYGVPEADYERLVGVSLRRSGS